MPHRPNLKCKEISFIVPYNQTKRMRDPPSLENRILLLKDATILVSRKSKELKDYVLNLWKRLTVTYPLIEDKYSRIALSGKDI